MNTSRPLFKNNVKLRQAVNWAISRGALLEQGGYYAGVLTDQILPPGMPGFKRVSVYPLQQTKQDVAKAQELAKGNTRGGKAILFTSTTPACPAQAEIYSAEPQGDRARRPGETVPPGGADPEGGDQGRRVRLHHRGLGGRLRRPLRLHQRAARRHEHQGREQQHVAYFDDPAYNKRMANASLLFGDQRYTTYAGLDADLMKNAAPSGRPAPTPLTGSSSPKTAAASRTTRSSGSTSRRSVSSRIRAGRSAHAKSIRRRVVQEPAPPDGLDDGDRLLERLLLGRGADLRGCARRRRGDEQPDHRRRGAEEGAAPLARPHRASSSPATRPRPRTRSPGS